jgi:hypothetical protein
MEHQSVSRSQKQKDSSSFFPGTAAHEQTFFQPNERENPSCFGSDMARLVAANDPEFLRRYRETMRQMVEEHPYSVGAYHAMGVFESLVAPYVESYRCP